MLHEGAGKPDSATRRFRGEAPLAWTLFRLSRCERLGECAVICWEDQAGAVRPIADEMKVRLWSPSARQRLSHLDSVSAARRWADGWRGGLLGACEFDRGFHGPSVAEMLRQTESDAVVLVDPSAGLVDFELIDRLIEHAEERPELDLCFSQAAPGLSGVLLHKRLVEQLASGGSHPGTLLSYRPDLPMHEPISTPSCAPVATSLARTCHRFTLDSERQIDRIASATVHLNGQLISTEAEQLVRFLDAAPAMPSLPREVVLELTVRRATRPIHSPLSSVKIDRADLAIDIARAVFDEMSSADDARIVFGGIGDPLLHPDFATLVESAQGAGIGAIAVETDLLEMTTDAIDRLVDLPIDIVSVNLPAISIPTYQAVMGVDGFQQVMANLTRFVQHRHAAARGTPLLVPTFFKTALNFAEMDLWYDHWLRVLGCAVIAGPSDYAGQIADVSLAQMEPPRRRPCARIENRLTILSDGRVVACEQDFSGREAMGRIGEKSINDIWMTGMSALRRQHADANWKCNGLCAACKDWHRR
jgi:hypothetical protein